MKTNKTYLATPEEARANQQWFVVDANGVTLGRLASKIARLIVGKHKPMYSPSVDCGDFVVVVNATKINVTGNRMEEKMYYRHSQYSGGFKEAALKNVLPTNPERVIKQAVWGMIPHTKLGKKMIKKLKVYAGSEHEHAAQSPVALEV
jgi:large subunit ribosomal protein L13